MEAPCRMETAATVRAALSDRPTETFEELPGLSALGPLTPLLFNLLYQPNATANLLLERGDECAVVATMDAKTFQERKPLMAQKNLSQWNWAKDLLVMDALVTEYPARLQDLDMLLALARAEVGGTDIDPSTSQPFKRLGQARSFIPMGGSTAMKRLTRDGAVVLAPLADS